ncbi:MAG: alpha/beta fold hydrolase [Gemmatimonadales bacterium]
MRIPTLRCVMPLALGIVALPSWALAQGDAEGGRPDSLAVEFLEQLVRRDFDAAVVRFDSTMGAVMPPAKLEETWDGLLAQVGEFREWSTTRQFTQEGFDIVLVSSAFALAAIDVQVVFDQDRRIAGLFFRPHQEALPVPDTTVMAPERVVEREVTIGSGEWALPGTLSFPTAGGPFPGVVLVHGSGPNDRDETIGPNTPFRDLAWGLSSRGVAVLRYEKRTREYRQRLATDGTAGFTVKQETVDDALSAVELLRRTEEIDPSRLVVVGHSLGGMLAPRIGRRDPHLAGLVVLAGLARQLEDVILEQIHYLAGLDSTISESERARLEQIEQEVALVVALDWEDSTSSARVLGAPASYWLDLRGYDPVGVAQELSIPMLILQGGRDYQVTIDDFRRWEEGLGDDPRVTLKVYPQLNHLFMTGEGPSGPAEYERHGQVADEVIEDIAAWITRLEPSTP